METAMTPQAQCLVLIGDDRRLAPEDRRQREGVWWRSRSVRKEGRRIILNTSYLSLGTNPFQSLRYF